MDYKIVGACTSNVGKIRDNNEDNFYFDGQILEEVNTGIEDILTTTFTNHDNHVYAIFDGMGGGSKGERASYLGATTLKEYREKNQVIDWNELVEKTNE